MTSPIPTEGGHTPGPWEVCGQFVRTPFRHGEPGAAGLMIADVRFGIWPPAQHEANARLIAAAPALLEALKAADEALTQFTAFESDARHIMGNTNFAIVQARREQVRAALAKATGGEDVLR